MTSTFAAADAVTAGTRVLRRALADRHAAHPDLPEPRVVTLGAHNVFDPGTDPDAPERRHATVHLSASVVVVGPFGSTAPGPCGHCLARRWQRLRGGQERQALEFGLTRGAAGTWPMVTPRVVDAIWQLYRAAAGADAPQAGTEDAADAWVWALDLESLLVRRFALLADSLCESCGGYESEPVFTDLPVVPKTAENRYRLKSTRDYRLPATALANPVCGVLGQTTYLTITSPTTAPVNGSITVHGYEGVLDMTWSGQANSFETSRDLAFIEGLERYAGISRRFRRAPVEACYHDVADRAIDPRECGLYSESTYDSDLRCSRFDPDKPIQWVEGTSLSSGRTILVPRQLVYYGVQYAEDNFVFDSSNGCATGGNLSEATLFGLLELIERDSFVLGWYGGARLTKLAIDRTADTELSLMLRRAELQGYDIHLFDNRIDLAVPAVTGVAVRRDGGPGLLSFAAAASLDPYTAVRGAVSEIITYLPESPKRLAERTDEARAMLEDYQLVRQLRDHPLMFALPEAAGLAERYLRNEPGVPMAEVYADYERNRPRTGDITGDVHYIRDELAAAGLEVVVVEQTSPEQRGLGLHTVSTVVPGLLPIDFGWARQRALHMPRMFSAYRRAGWRASDLTEAELHSVPHPFP